MFELVVEAERQQGTGGARLDYPEDPAFLEERVESYYRDRLEGSWGGLHPLRGRSPQPGAVQMRTNDYLCLAGHPHVIESEVQALRTGGHGDAVSRVWLHQEKDSTSAFEARIAALMCAQDALLCNSGYCANVGLIQSIAGADTPVYLDMKAHISLWEGVSSAKARPIPFRHNSPGHLERKIRENGPGIICADALYSTDGNVAPLETFVEIAERLDCVLVIDETHSFGTHGPQGAGLCVAQGLSHRVHFRTVGLSKAVASRGGVIVSSQRNAEYLRYEALPAIFSTSVLQHEVAGYNAVLDVLAEETWRRDDLHKNHRRMKTALDALGYNVDASRHQIIALEAGPIRDTIRLRDALEARNVFGAIFFPPATAEKRCLVRFTVNCGLSTDEIGYVIKVCADIRDEVCLGTWASTRRKRRNSGVPRPVCHAPEMSHVADVPATLMQPQS